MIKHHTKIFKILKKICLLLFNIKNCMTHIKMHLYFNFSINNYIFRFNELLNNTSSIFWNMNLLL
jgi:hypothetical protein